MGAPAFKPTQGEQRLSDALRAAGAETVAARVLAEGLPHRRIEAWKWSDLRAALTPDLVPDLDEADDVGTGDDVVSALANALDAAETLVVPAGERLELADALDAFGGLEIAYRRIEVGEGAELVRTVIQKGDGVVVDQSDVILAKDARFTQVVLAFGARLARIETRVTVIGEGAQTRLDAAYLVGEGRHADITSLVRHEVGHCETRQTVKGAVAGGGRGVFQGKVYVARGAQKVDSEMEHHALLLDARAEANAKPELEIYADDVVCSHGNTCGELDADALFYLRQRGVPLAEAKAILTEAFIAEALDAIDDEETKALCLADARAWLTGGGASHG